MQFFIPFWPISAHPQYLNFTTEHLNLNTIPLVLPTLTSPSLCHFKQSALSCMSKISIASFSSSNRYSCGHSLTVGFRALLWRHTLAGLGRSSNSMCFTYQNIHCVCISYSSLINALAIHFISAIFVQFICKPALFNKFCYFSLLVTFLHHKFYYFLELLTKLQFWI